MLMKRSLCINPLFTMFLVKMLFANNEKGVSNRKYGDRGFRLGLCPGLSIVFVLSLFGGTPCVGDLSGHGPFLWGRRKNQCMR